MGYDFECGHHAPAFECDACTRYFDSERARFQHMEALNHFEWECSVCDETWPTDTRRTEHEYDDHYYCRQCQEPFRNQNDLKMHLNSRTHRGQQIQCPFCKGSFTTATGLTHHVEAGSCPNAAGLTRDTLYKFVRSKDPNSVITKNLIGWHGSTQYEANDQSYNWERQGWECYLCHGIFRLLQSLNQHLNSPVHQENLYHCPNRNCGKESTTLAGIMNHLESESCGHTRFENVQRSIRGVVSGNKLIAF
ncbi:Zinc finger X-chromosomal protein [Madurella mycetomatis]|uniref:Zinc finger X-chromosomal protein n=1 Tax=Madurella mycetomatis TaxID=100816 RepID=A0A175W1P1_9PEZI|nr:Zinc finger X-chromosomal protein [Madurella mycetomatis]